LQFKSPRRDDFLGGFAEFEIVLEAFSSGEFGDPVTVEKSESVEAF
jgi:hypothetical protein